LSAVSVIRSLVKNYSMEDLYKQIGKSRQSYEQQRKRNVANLKIEEQMIGLVKQMRQDHPRMGSRTMYHTLNELGFVVPLGITRFEQLVSRSKLTVGTAKSRSPRTSDGLGKRNYPNLTNGLSINNINQLIVGDITYFWVSSRWCYIFVLKDVYSQRVISMIPSEDMRAYHALANLNELVELRGEACLRDCIFHSDNGSQYESTMFTKELNRLDMQISRSAICSQNGSSEQCNHIIKNMYLEHFGIRSYEDLVQNCKRVQYLVNYERTIEQLGNISADKFEQQITVLNQNQRPIKTLYDFNKE